MMSKYTRTIMQTIDGEDRGCTLEVDVYDVLRAFAVTDPAIQHAVKKLLCSGNRGQKDRRQDLEEAVQSIERAIDVLRADKVFGEVLAVKCESPPDSPQSIDCPFTAGDMIAPKVNPGDLWYICAVMADSMLLQKPAQNEDFTVPARYYDRWQLCIEAEKQPAECPFAVGDVIRSTTFTEGLCWRVTEILSDKVVGISDDHHQVEAWVLQRDWPAYAIVKHAAIDKPDATC